MFSAILDKLVSYRKCVIKYLFRNWKTVSEKYKGKNKV